MTEENSKFAILRVVAPNNIAAQVKDYYYNTYNTTKTFREEKYGDNTVFDLAIPVEEIEEAMPLALSMFENFGMYYSGSGEDSNATQSIRVLFPEKKVQTLTILVSMAYGTVTNIIELINIELFRAYSGNFSSNEIALTKLAV